jgi:hypothetical protein
MIGLEYIMINPTISYEEMFKRLDRAIKEGKRKFSSELWGD